MNPRFCFRSLACSIIFGAILASPALAIGPSDQTISPTDNRIVRVLIDVGLGDGFGFMEGTGSVVANTNVAGQGYLWVLTADHVISSNSSHGGSLASGIGLAFGNSPDDSGNTSYFANAQASPLNIFRGGPTGNEDIALFGIHYGAFDSSKNSLRVNLATTSNNTAFTDIGYGDEGDLAADGYNAQFAYGTQRYFNENIFGYSSAFHPGGYTYSAGEFLIEDPSNPNTPAHSGAALDADSGSPLFMSSFNGTYYTDSQFAILTAVVAAGGESDFPFGSTELAMSLSAADLAWINTSAGVPEPAILAPLAVVSFLLARRRV